MGSPLRSGDVGRAARHGTRTVEVVIREGKTRRLKQPCVDAAKCVGCGICEPECPLRGPAAVRVGSLVPTI